MPADINHFMAHGKCHTYLIIHVTLSPLIFHHSSFITQLSSLIFHYSSFITHLSLLIFHHSSITTHLSLLILHHSTQSLGASAVLIKPIDMDLFDSTMKQLIEAQTEASKNEPKKTYKK